jgi:CDP-6-deoxy-D-xylo-4-hexulose-3-dehydrase
MKAAQSKTSANARKAPKAKPAPTPRRVLYAEAVYGKQEIDAVTEVLKNRPHQLMNGPAVSEFETKVARLFGKQHGIMTNSGSSANTLALGALDLPPDSEIITPTCTFSTTVAPIVQQGLIPSFVDIELDTFVIDVNKIEEAITPRTRAMLIPNLIGNLADWPRLRELADRYKLYLIEDSADTIGSTVGGEPTGKLSDVSTTSFYASHVMTCGGFGGMASFNEPRLAKRALLLRGWGRSSVFTGESEKVQDRFSSSIDGMAYDSKFIFEGIGYNFLPSEIAAAFGLAQLEKLPGYIDTRIRNFAALTRFFKRHEEWFVLPRQTANTRTPWLAVALVVRDSAPFRRRDLQMHFETHGVQTRPIFAGNILRHPGFSAIKRRDSAHGYPNSDQVMRGGILLGCHQGMDTAQTDYICDVFEQFAQQF